MSSNHPGQFYQRLNVKKIINASSWITAYGGSIMPPSVLEAMEDASHWFVDMHDLNSKAGEIIARFTGAEAGLVTAGSAAGMVLEAAACMAGTDPAKAWRLPDTTGMKNEIVIHRSHRVNYDHNFRAAGATLVEIGNSSTTEEWELENAINANTAAVAHIFGPSQSASLPLTKVVEIAHAKDVPVIVDAAAMLPPVENLTRYIAMGADMVSFSGGKGVLGPQSSGILCGRKDLVEAAYFNGSPNSNSIGRAAKVCKEEIAGLITALELFVDTDHQIVVDKWRAKCAYIVDSIDNIPGVIAHLGEAQPELDEFPLTQPRATISFDKSWTGPNKERVEELLESGEPSIRVRSVGSPRHITISPTNLIDGDEVIITRRIREILTQR